MSTNHPRSVAEARNQPRLKLPAMYTTVRVRPEGHARYTHVGHVYDISLSGMRFELDKPIEPGQTVHVRVLLPGTRSQAGFNAVGRVVRLHDDSPEQGPARMGMHFDQFVEAEDGQRLEAYLRDHGLRFAA